MKKERRIEYLKAENAELRDKIKEQQSVIDGLLAEKEKAEKDILFMRGQIYAFEYVHH